MVPAFRSSLYPLQLYDPVSVFFHEYFCVAVYIYNFSVGSYTGVVCEVLTISSVMIGILRIDIPRLRGRGRE